MNRRKIFSKLQMNKKPEIFQCFLPTCSQNIWVIDSFCVFIRAFECLITAALKNWTGLSSSQENPATPAVPFETDKWLSLNACALSPQQWIPEFVSPLLGFLQETWGLKDELEKEASGTSAFKDCLRGNGHRLRDLELHSLWKTTCSSHYSEGKECEIFGNLEEEKKTSIISKIFFWYLPSPLSTGFPTQTHTLIKGA